MFIVLVLRVTTTLAIGAESRSKRSIGSNYNKTPYSIIWVELPMVIDREHLGEHINVKFLIRDGAFVQKIGIERLCVANFRERFNYSLTVPLPQV